MDEQTLDLSLKKETEMWQVKIARFQYLINALGYLQQAQREFVLKEDVHKLLAKEIREVTPHEEDSKISIIVPNGSENK